MNELIAYLIGLLHSYSIVPVGRKRAIDANGSAGSNRSDWQRRMVEAPK